MQNTSDLSPINGILLFTAFLATPSRGSGLSGPFQRLFQMYFPETSITILTEHLHLFQTLTSNIHHAETFLWSVSQGLQHQVQEIAEHSAARMQLALKQGEVMEAAALGEIMFFTTDL